MDVKVNFSGKQKRGTLKNTDTDLEELSSFTPDKITKIMLWQVI
jgi:hypothetical protein